jgi:hypothetical protein
VAIAVEKGERVEEARVGEAVDVGLSRLWLYDISSFTYDDCRIAVV